MWTESLVYSLTTTVTAVKAPAVDGETEKGCAIRHASDELS